MTDLYVASPEALHDLVERLRGAEWLAVDTEFMRESTYRAQLCLVQVVVPRDPPSTARGAAESARAETARVEAASDAYRVANHRAIGLSTAFIPIIRMAISLGFAGSLWTSKTKILLVSRPPAQR